MVFVSIYPFALKKIFLLVVAFLCLSSAFCLADSLFMTRRFAPDQHRRSPSVSGDASGSERSLTGSLDFIHEDSDEMASFVSSSAVRVPHLSRAYPLDYVHVACESKETSFSSIAERSLLF
jgi:hypothetical protein